MTFSFDLSVWQLVAMTIDYAIKFVMICLLYTSDAADE